MADELKEIIKRTNKADPAPADMAALQQYIAEHGATEIARIGDMNMLAQTKILQALDSSYTISVGIVERITQLTSELGYNAATPLERLLIDNITLCWLRYHIMELNYTLVAQESSARSWLWERRLTQAHRRYLRSIEALAKVRRLLHKPNVAFNFLLKQPLGGGR